MTTNDEEIDFVKEMLEKGKVVEEQSKKKSEHIIEIANDRFWIKPTRKRWYLKRIKDDELTDFYVIRANEKGGLLDNRTSVVKRLKAKLKAFVKHFHESEFEVFKNTLIRKLEEIKLVGHGAQGKSLEERLKETKEKEERKAVLLEEAESLDRETKDVEIKELAEKALPFSEEFTEEFFQIIAKKTFITMSDLEKLLMIARVKKIAEEEEIDLNINTITDEDIFTLASHVNLNKPGEITGLFLMLKSECHFNEGSVKLSLLPKIEELTFRVMKLEPMFLMRESLYLYQKRGVYEVQEGKARDMLNEMIREKIPFFIKQLVGETLYNKRVEAVCDEIIARIRIDEEELDLDIINLRNGLLRLSDIREQKWTIYPHSPEYKTIVQLNVSFNPFLVCREKIIYKTFLKRMLEDQTRNLLKLYGAALTQRPHKYKVITILIGPSGTGKSEVILRVIEKIVPDDYIGHADLHKLCLSNDDSFESGELMGKIVNINGDLSRNPLEDQSELNRLTEPKINVNVKHRFKGQILNRVTFFCACNRPPTLVDLDRTDSFRRLYEIDIQGDPIPENDVEMNYFEKLTEKHPNEIPYMFNLILDHLGQVLRDDNLKLPKIALRKEKHRKFSNTLYSFLLNYITQYETDKDTKPNDTWLIDRDLFLTIYNQYRESLNYEPYDSTHALTRENNTLKKDIKLYTRLKKGNRVYFGVQFNEEGIKRFKIGGVFENQEGERTRVIWPPKRIRDKEGEIGLGDWTEKGEEIEIDVEELFECEEKDSKERKMTLGDLGNLIEHAGFDITDFNHCRKIYENVKEIFQGNEYELIEEKSLRQNLGVRDLKIELTEKMIKFMKEEEILLQVEKKLKFAEKWR